MQIYNLCFSIDTNSRIKIEVKFSVFWALPIGQAFALAFFVKKQKRAQTVAQSLTHIASLKRK